MLELSSEAPVLVLAGQFIRDDITSLAQQAVDLQLASDPRVQAYCVGDRYAKSIEDTSFHLHALTQALLVEEPSLFVSYVIWAEVVLSNLCLPQGCLAGSLVAIRHTLDAALPETLSVVVGQYFELALTALGEASVELPPAQRAPLADVALGYLAALLAGDRGTAADIVHCAVSAGAVLPDIYEHVFKASQHEVGRMWQSNRVSVAMEHYATSATEAIMSQHSGMESPGASGERRFVGACVEGEEHDMAIRMICDVLRSKGWDTYFLGANTPVSALVLAVEEFRPSVVGLSATWLFNLDSVRRAVQCLRETDPDVKIVVGGAPFDRIDGLFAKVGADARGTSLFELPAQLDSLIAWNA